MFNKKKIKETYKVVFCDENDLATKFGEFGVYETYDKADHVIRMGWNKKREDKVNNGYRINGSWILIEKTS